VFLLNAVLPWHGWGTRVDESGQITCDVSVCRCMGTTCTERRPPHMTSVPHPATWRTRTRRTHTSPTWKVTTACITTRPAHNAGDSVDTRIQGTLIQQAVWKATCFSTSVYTGSCHIFMDINTCYSILFSIPCIIIRFINPLKTKLICFI
jgi:hypothetical protein